MYQNCYIPPVQSYEQDLATNFAYHNQVAIYQQYMTNHQYQMIMYQQQNPYHQMANPNPFYTHQNTFPQNNPSGLECTQKPPSYYSTPENNMPCSTVGPPLLHSELQNKSNSEDTNITGSPQTPLVSQTKAKPKVVCRFCEFETEGKYRQDLGKHERACGSSPLNKKRKPLDMSKIRWKGTDNEPYIELPQKAREKFVSNWRRTRVKLHKMLRRDKYSSEMSLKERTGKNRKG